MTIRKATPGDFPVILDLIQEFSMFQQTPEKVWVTLEQMKEDQHLFHCFVAETEQEELAGFASFFFAYYSWSGKAIYLDDLYVRASYRQQGIGRQLLDAVVALAKAENCRKLRWQVSRWNKPAIDFYKRYGAQIDEVEINCDLNLQMG